MSGALDSLLGSDDDRPDAEATVTRRQLQVAAVGAVLVAVSLALGFSGAVTIPGLTPFFAGVVGLGVAAWLAQSRLSSSVTLTRPPVVRRRAGVRRTGERLEVSARQADTGDRQERGSARVIVKRRLAPLARSVVGARSGMDEDSASEAVSDGTWSDDAVATRLLDDENDDGLVPPWLRRRPSVRTQVRRVATLLGRERLGDVDAPRYGPPGGDEGPGVREWRPGNRETGRWRGVGVAGVATLGLAAFGTKPGLILVAAVLLGLAGYARLGVAPEPTLAVERELAETDPRPGDRVTVDVTVENVGERFLPDVRVVDAVPPDLRVVEGSAHHATALRPGEETSFSYDVLAVYGDHDFEGLYALARDASGHHECAERVEDGAVTLTCEPREVRESVPLHPQTSGVVGRVPTNVGGSGHEFHAVREYRPGDPLRRVDWNRVARTGDLATLQFREEHAATVVILVDTRADAFRAPSPDALSAVDRSLTGAAQVYASLLDDGDRVGLANVGLDWTWIGPGAGNDHRSRVREALQRDPNFGGTGTETMFSVERYVTRLRRRLPSEAQLVLFSPLLDEESATVARRLHAHGHSVTAFSPDPTTTDTVGGLVARIERSFAVSRLQRAGIPVVDWAEEPLEVAVERAERRWRR